MQVTERDKQIEECAIMLAKLFASERNDPFWGNYVHQFRDVVRDLTSVNRIARQAHVSTP